MTPLLSLGVLAALLLVCLVRQVAAPTALVREPSVTCAVEEACSTLQKRGEGGIVG